MGKVKIKIHSHSRLKPSYTDTIGAILIDNCLFIYGAHVIKSCYIVLISLFLTHSCKLGPIISNLSLAVLKSDSDDIIQHQAIFC